MNNDDIFRLFSSMISFVLDWECVLTAWNRYTIWRDITRALKAT
jgi:hypothetical protein